MTRQSARQLTSVETATRARAKRAAIKERILQEEFDAVGGSLQEAFAPATFLGRTAVSSSTELEACRVNAKKEKRQRNRENMRKFAKRGKTSRKKMMRKVASQQARQEENEFLAKCFMTVPPPEGSDQGSR
eukprot:CAMPEP_0181020190 /NCGR_PEP_ID=MMETSP1070-20121207/316_1 /TAXON_ID=265543 /ORGANISM="Minutocellus polymorphus, Strain NH13" /LENGTH=130 /DNA_ID=CAMNT_0023096983 /DNA_START=462 /DNA_END=855 /DNA_ORIENTATION=-